MLPRAFAVLTAPACVLFFFLAYPVLHLHKDAEAPRLAATSRAFSTNELSAVYGLMVQYTHSDAPDCPLLLRYVGNPAIGASVTTPTAEFANTVTMSYRDFFIAAYANSSLTSCFPADGKISLVQSSAFASATKLAQYRAEFKDMVDQTTVFDSLYTQLEAISPFLTSLPSDTPFTCPDDPMFGQHHMFVFFDESNPVLLSVVARFAEGKPRVLQLPLVANVRYMVAVRSGSTCVYRVESDADLLLNDESRPSDSPSPTPSVGVPSPTATSSPSLFASASVSATPSSSVTVSPSVSPSPSVSVTPSASPTASPSLSATPSPSATASTSLTPSPSTSLSPTPSTSLSPTPSTSLSPTPSTSLSPTPSTSLSPTPSTSLSPTPSTSLSPSPSSSQSPSPSMSASPTASATVSPTQSPTASPSVPASATPSLSVGASPSNTAEPSPSASITPTASVSASPSVTPRPSASTSPLSPAAFPSALPSPTASVTPSLSVGASPSGTASLSPSASASASVGAANLAILPVFPNPAETATPSPSMSASPSVGSGTNPLITAGPSFSASASPSVGAPAAPSTTGAPSPSVSTRASPAPGGPTASPSFNPTVTPTPPARDLPSATVTPTVSASPSASASVGSSPSVTPTSGVPSPSASSAAGAPQPSQQMSPAPSGSFQPSASPSTGSEPTQSPSPAASTGTGSPGGSIQPTPSQMLASPTVTPTVVQSQQPSPSMMTPSPSASPGQGSRNPRDIVLPSSSPTPGLSQQPVASATVAPSATPSTPSEDGAAIEAMSPEPSSMDIVVLPRVPTPVASPVSSPTASASGTVTPSPRMTYSVFPSVSVTPSPSMSSTPRPSTTATYSGTPSASMTPSPSASIGQISPSVSPSPHDMDVVASPPMVIPVNLESPEPADDTPTQEPEGPSPTPSASPSTEEVVEMIGRGICFPRLATVKLADGTVRTMENLRLGDRVQVGLNKYSNIVFFTHALRDVVARFVLLRTASGHAIRLTEGHFLYLNGRLGAAREARVGDIVRFVGDGVVGMSEIVEVGSTVERGLYNPQTAAGDIVVDGVVASCYTEAIKPGTAHSLLMPLRAGVEFVPRTFLRYVAGIGGRNQWVWNVLPELYEKRKVFVGK